MCGVPPAWCGSSYCGHQIRPAFHNSFLPFYYAYDMVFMLTGLHRVLIIHQTLVRTCCVPGIIPRKAIIVVIVFERTKSHISYFLCLSLKQRVSRLMARGYLFLLRRVRDRML